jgi:hypothetical protein
MKKIIGLFTIVLISNQLISQNNYLHFDGVDDHVQVSDNPVYNFSGDFTVEAKFKRDGLTGRGDVFVKKDLNSVPQSSNAVALFIGNDNRVYFWLRETTSSTPVTLVSTTVTDNISWMQITGKRSGNVVSLYINGVQEATGIMSSDLTSNGPLTIGSNRQESLNPNSPVSYPFQGVIDEVRVWDVSRTSQEIQSTVNMELTGSEFGLISYFNFNQGVPCAQNSAVTILNNSLSSGGNGTLIDFDLSAALSDPCFSNWNGEICQDSLALICNKDAALGYHDGFSTGSNNYGSAVQNSAYCLNGTSSGVNINRSIFEFDYSNIPTNAIIIEAKLDLYALGASGTLSGHTGLNNEGVLTRITSPWVENTVTFNTQPSDVSTNSVILNASISSNQDYIDIDVTNIVIDQVANNNYGFLLKQLNEAPTNALTFCSSDHSNLAKHPQLKIVYSICQSDSVNDSTSLNIELVQSDAEQYRVYPNPMSNRFQISGGDYYPQCIIDISGKLVYSYNSQGLLSEGSIIELPESLTTGIYFFYYKSETGLTKVNKIVVNRN